LNEYEVLINHHIRLLEESKSKAIKYLKNNMNYSFENRIVVFIDILGFAEKINQAKSDPLYLNNLCKALYSIQCYIKEAETDLEFNKETTSITQFSDSVVISVKLENSYDILAIFKLLKRIQVNLVQDQILIRGGIVKGDLIHNKDLLLGPGLVDAYYLESKCAQYPRILIDPKVLWQNADEIGLPKKPFRIKDYDHHKTFIPDLDGTFYIDYFNDVDEYLNSNSIEVYYRNLCEQVKAYIENKNIGTRVKYLWMREKLKRSEYYNKFKGVYDEVIRGKRGSVN